MQQDNKHQLLSKLWFAFGLVLGLTQCATQPIAEPVSVGQSSLPQAQPTLTIEPWPNAERTVAHIHIVTIPPDYPVDVAVGNDLKTVAEFAAETNALAVLNGGFFDPNNAQTTSFITVNGRLVADPRQNARLVDNPDLAVYMDKILNRSEVRRYHCGEEIRYDITLHNASVPDDCVLHTALGAGPQLLPVDTSQAEGFTDYSDGVLIRDAIGSQQRNARSAIGLKTDGTLVWLMVAKGAPAGGMTLAELAEYMSDMGIQKGLNLDGGSSSSLYAAWSETINDGLSEAYHGRLPQNEQQPIQRSVKSVLFLPTIATAD